MKNGHGAPETGSQYRPEGELCGDYKPMPDRGTGTGVTDTYGADLGVDSTNRIGSIRSTSKSDGMDFA